MLTAEEQAPYPQAELLGALVVIDSPPEFGVTLERAEPGIQATRGTGRVGSTP